jgi:hypothetical protein
MTRLGQAAAMSRPGLYTQGFLLDATFPLPLDKPFTYAQARAAGVSRSVLARLVREGHLRRMLQSVYVTASVVDGLELRCKALALVAPPGAVVTDWTAVWLWTGMLPWGDHLRVPPVSVFLHAGQGRLRNGLVDSGERSFVGRDLAVVDGLTVTTPLRTACDVGRLSHRDLAMAGLDALLRHGSFTLEEVLAELDRFRRQRGVVQLRLLAPLAISESGSAAESVLRLRWLDLASLPRPEPQVPVVDDRGREVYYLDLGVPALRFAAEYDGEEFHTSEEDREHDADRRAWISRDRGWVISVVRRHNLFGASRDVESILHQGVDEARRKQGRS